MGEPFRPKLPPRAGYIEIEADGVRQYKKIETAESRRLEEQEETNMLILDLLAEHEYQLCMSQLMGGETI